MLDKIFSLPIVEQLSPYVSQRNMDDFPLLVVSHPKARGVISLQGAHLITWQPNNEKPVLWVSDNTLFSAGTAIRGGIPICWPWFGSFTAPNHGFARILPWELKAHDENENGVILTFTLQDNAYTRKLWPHEFTLIARFKLGETCEIELESHGEYQAMCALHSYFNVSDINQIRVSGLGSHFIDTLTDSEQYIDEDLAFHGRTDRIYTESDDFNLLRDPLWKRTIEIHHYHHSEVVCWNPGAALSSSMKDMSKEGYKNMACIETARINNPLQPKNGNPDRLSVIIRCRKFSDNNQPSGI
ncbi:D-hexose-6-phosphate mutarotase [Xenorhabdus griffiniae]|uniref:Putative glucose-6-phosphate 1-epimerase n=1 Tax=Xenorhabdus griffiniae TaxID=351672 RepID=A0ABY9XN51_9GAMM|nr:D-hexose-6-phosphate mutarotase [Xenorhabdus griffiniae]MBD1227005.1 D-hexose-6-phosphate mutarotase [Xenorhabdus griffiniae]MBE8588620.1 D-hexose-6-phosphate mutarotase [Xenorhabdus griffiniae]WMV74236.1 D-hexose-6-phosphate mutarotase [Xenorhabdus griffiniae]WNH03916.1 D-hexose-6-phosphate mutarotase [Xenorhabdus griffiniae]